MAARLWLFSGKRGGGGCEPTGALGGGEVAFRAPFRTPRCGAAYRLPSLVAAPESSPGPEGRLAATELPPPPRRAAASPGLATPDSCTRSSPVPARGRPRVLTTSLFRPPPRLLSPPSPPPGVHRFQFSGSPLPPARDSGPKSCPLPAARLPPRESPPAPLLASSHFRPVPAELAEVRSAESHEPGAREPGVRGGGEGRRGGRGLQRLS